MTQVSLPTQADVNFKVLVIESEVAWVRWGGSVFFSVRKENVRVDV